MHLRRLLPPDARTSATAPLAFHQGGSEKGTLSNGLGSICFAIGAGAQVSFEECEITTETSTAIFASGRFTQVQVDTCVVGPNGWECESSSGYGICIFREVRVRVRARAQGLWGRG